MVQRFTQAIHSPAHGGVSSSGLISSKVLILYMVNLYNPCNVFVEFSLRFLHLPSSRDTDKDLEADLADHLMSTQRHHQQLGMMPVGYPVSYQQLVSRDRRGSVDLASGSDGGSSSVPSSAASSSLHLPDQSQIPFNVRPLQGQFLGNSPLVSG